jgi:hypothetical protein
VSEIHWDDELGYALLLAPILAVPIALLTLAAWLLHRKHTHG